MVNYKFETSEDFALKLDLEEQDHKQEKGDQPVFQTHHFLHVHHAHSIMYVILIMTDISSSNGGMIWVGGGGGGWYWYSKSSPPL